MLQSNRRVQGFTLIEMVIVIVLIGILSAVAMPRFYNFTSSANKAVAQATATELSDSVNILTAMWNASAKPSVIQTGPAGSPTAGLHMNASGVPDNAALSGYASLTTAAAVSGSFCATLFQILLSDNSVQANSTSGTLTSGQFYATTASVQGASPTGTAAMAALTAASSPAKLTVGGTTGCLFVKFSAVPSSITSTTYSSDTGMAGVYYEVASGLTAVVTSANF